MSRGYDTYWIFNVEKLVCSIPFHFRAQQQQQQHLAIPKTATTSQIYTTTMTHNNKDTTIEEQNMLNLSGIQELQ
jgi:hypothetical protein